MVAWKNLCAVRCTLALTKSHGTVSQVINWRTNDFKRSTIFTKLNVFLDLTTYSKKKSSLILKCFAGNCRLEDWLWSWKCSREMCRLELSHEHDAGCSFVTVEFQRIFYRCFHPEMAMMNGWRMTKLSFQCSQPQEKLMDLPKRSLNPQSQQSRSKSLWIGRM